MAQAPHIAPLKKDEQLQIGDRVVVDKDKHGQIKWIGEHQVLGTGKFYGVRLTEKRGLCNGTYKEVKFFWSPENYGVLVPASRITGRYLDSDFDFREEKEPIKVDPGIEQIKQKRKELQKLKKKFRAMDKDGDLLVDQSEFFKLVTGSEGLFPKMTVLEVKKLFEDIDVTKSGKISFAEFDAWVQSLGGVHVMEHKDFVKIRQQFVDMDKNKDKKISLEEFTTAFGKVFPKMNSEEAVRLFNEIDVSHNGTIEFEEYDSWVKQQES